MNVDLTGFYQIAVALAEHFDCMYYVDIQTGKFIEFIPPKLLNKWNLPKEGNDFFEMSNSNAEKCVHPDDLERVLRVHDKEIILKELETKKSYSISCRIILSGKMIHVRHVFIKCEDKEHILCCMENIEAEYQEKSEQKKNLQTAERMARQDDLTGIKNKTAFTEQLQLIDNKIIEDKDIQFGVVMCDLNDLKLLNDTRGHSFGDEAIQRTSQMICEVFKHSPVFRIGGDEFVAIITDHDYENREALLQELQNESRINKKTRSGPVVASGMAVFDPATDKDFTDVFKRADSLMYENKNELKKSSANRQSSKEIAKNNSEITKERKMQLDSLYGALLTMSDEGYVFLDDMQYDYSRWSLSLVKDFGLESAYMYEAEKVWASFIHPEDVAAYLQVIAGALHGTEELKPVHYRVRKADGTYIMVTFRGFLLNDSNGTPDYFGGIIVPQ